MGDFARRQVKWFFLELMMLVITRVHSVPDDEFCENATFVGI